MAGSDSGFDGADFREAIKFVDGKKRKGRPPKVVNVSEVYNRNLNGESISALSRSMGIHPERIHAALQEAGLTPVRNLWGKHHPRWSGGRTVNVHGYVSICLDKDDPLRGTADRNGRVYEHRYVMAKALGRALYAHETVHHIDGNKQNNDLSNLQLRFGAHGEGFLAECRTCGSFDIEFKEIP